MEVSTLSGVTSSGNQITENNGLSTTLNSAGNSISNPYLQPLNSPRIVPYRSPIADPSKPITQEQIRLPTSTQ